MKNKQKNKWLKAISVTLSCALLATAAPVGVLADEVTDKQYLDIQFTNPVDNVKIADDDYKAIWTHFGADTFGNPETPIINADSGVYINTDNSIITEHVWDTNKMISCVFENQLYGANFSRNEEDVLVVDEMERLAGRSCYPDYEVKEYQPYEISFDENEMSYESLGSDIINSIENEGMPEYDMYLIIYRFMTEDGEDRWAGSDFILEGKENDTVLKFVEDKTEEGTCGDNAKYTLDSNGLLTISGEGAIHTGAFLDNTNIKNVVIEEGITSIGNNAFGRCSNLTSISIPKGVTTIENAAFNGCKSLTSITLPEGITSINWRVFEGCTNLTSIELPVSLTRIGEDAFSGALTDIYYAGTEAQWNEIEIDMYAIPDTATIHFESVNKDDTTTDTDDTTTKNEPYTKDLSSGNTSISASDFANILEENKTKDVVIKSNNGVSFTFAKGSMSAVDGMEDYDFGTTLVSDFANAGDMGSSVTKDNFVARINYNYSGKLPAKAFIKILVGKDYAGKTLYYSQLLENGFQYMQSVVVDGEGYVTVTQDHCSDYVLTTNELGTTDTTTPPSNSNTPSDTSTPPSNNNTQTDAPTSPKTGNSSNILLYVMMVVFGTGIVAVGMRRKFYN